MAIHDLSERQTTGLTLSLRLLYLRVILIGQNNKLSAVFTDQASALRSGHEHTPGRTGLARRCN